jgi:hypothetical protein
VIGGLIDSSNGEAPVPTHRLAGRWGNPCCHAPNQIGARRRQGSPCAAKKGGIDKTMPKSGVGVEPEMWGRSSNNLFLQKQFQLFSASLCRECTKFLPRHLGCESCKRDEYRSRSVSNTKSAKNLGLRSGSLCDDGSWPSTLFDAAPQRLRIVANTTRTLRELWTGTLIPCLLRVVTLSYSRAEIFPAGPQNLTEFPTTTVE